MVIAFAECMSLISITMLSSVKSIGGAAFYGCTSLTSIGRNAFYNCSSLKIYCEATSKPSDGILIGKVRIVKLYGDIKSNL